MNTKLPLARLLLAAALSALGLWLVACGDGQDRTEQRARTPGSADAAPARLPAPDPSAAGVEAGAKTIVLGDAVTMAGVVFAPPAAWRDLGPAGMRQAQYQLAPVADDPAPAEVAVFYFGPASGGGVEANLQRWIGQMSLPDGGDPGAAAARGTFTVSGMNAHLVALDGTYNAGGMGGPMSGGGEPDPGYRLVGVVLEGPQGSLFFKLTGPVATARTMEAGLLAMVHGARPAS